jgi:hypothetical protein
MLVMQLYRPAGRSYFIFSSKSIFHELQQRFGIDMTKAIMTYFLWRCLCICTTITFYDSLESTSYITINAATTKLANYF